MSPFIARAVVCGALVLTFSALTEERVGFLPQASAQATGSTNPAHAHQNGSLPDGDDTGWAVLEQYCVDCHNFTDQAGGVAFDILPRDTLYDDAAVWEKIVRKIRTGLMPPAGEPRPEREVLDDLAFGIENQLDNEYSRKPRPGEEDLSRLTRTEYANAIRDLLSFDAYPVMDKVPDEDPEGLFDNMASELSVSPTLIDAYISTAMRISREAVGDTTKGPTQVRYEVPEGPQTHHLDGLPLGSRGGAVIEHNYPLDAEYEIRIASAGLGVFGGVRYCGLPSVVIALDGEPVEVEDPESFTLAIPAGEHELAVALQDERRCEGVNELYEDYSLEGAIQAVEIHGPYNPGGPGNTSSRQAIFSCYPENNDQETACARRIMSRLATLAYRQPVEPRDPAVDDLMAFYRKGAAQGSFETGIQQALSRLLIDPKFLYKIEKEPEGLAEGEIYRIDDLELASRLSFFLWSSIPDKELIELAEAGRLGEPEVLRKQVRRMLDDERSKALVENFASQWLHLKELDEALPQDPAFNDRLRQAFRAETEMLFEDLISEDYGVLHLLSADYTYLNQELAQHYGIAGVTGDYMRKVRLPGDSPRGGLLGQGSILTATSVPNRTSPVIRGEWIVDNILGAPVPVPPPGVEADLSAQGDDETSEPRTLRERLEMHLASPACASCHQIMDPVGFALENFDLVGRWREKDSGYPIDTTADLVDGTTISGPADLRRALLNRGHMVATSFTEKLLSYALGRTLGPYDMSTVREIVNGSKADDYRFSEIVQGIVQSKPFQMKMKAEGGGA